MLLLLWLWLAAPWPGTGTVRLPPGRIDLHTGIRLPDGAHDLIVSGQGTTLYAAADFRGRALLSCSGCRNLTVRDLQFDGNRAALETTLPLAPADVPFSRFFPNNGILIEDGVGVRLERLGFTAIPNFAILVSHSKQVHVGHVTLSASGSRNAKGRNNTSGGILLEQGTEQFEVSDSVFRQIRGNGVWTHSCYGSPRNSHGLIERNDFSDIGRDAIQVGEATEVTVARNTGRRIGFKLDEVDLEGLGTPVGVDTAGNVDKSIYEDNRFEEFNGKCIDLDGFHDGTVRRNVCINRGPPEQYPYGNFGIALNNTSIEMQSRNILIEGNTLQGLKFGGIFVVGSGHRILHNTMTRLNTAHCNETHARFGCIAILDEPAFLESGIYLSAHADKRDPSRNITIEDNVISGWKMSLDCIRAGPGVSMADIHMRTNRCSDE